ncbi:DUF6290 family protein [Erysipelothrix rhusiopathiae]|nr:DUF6290 family protein [Erysipelothrix rhusiopathiae]
MITKKNKKGKRIAVSVSLTEREREKYSKMAETYGLSLSAFFRLAAEKYIENDNKEVK